MKVPQKILQQTAHAESAEEAIASSLREAVAEHVRSAAEGWSPAQTAQRRSSLYRLALHQHALDDLAVNVG